MRTITIAHNEITSDQLRWGTDSTSQQEESYNKYWAALYQHVKNLKDEDIDKLIQSLPFAAGESKINPKNLEAIRILNQWFAEPDDLGEEFWNEFCDDLEKNRFTI